MNGVRLRRRRPKSRRVARGRPLALGRAALALCAMVLAPPGALATTVYVIDRLLLGVHETNELDSAIIKLLPSGTALDVLEREGSLARVRSPGGFEGWVDAAYLSEEQPASLTTDKLHRLISDGTREMERARQIIGELERDVAELTGRAEQAEEELRVMRSSTQADASPATPPVAPPQTLVEVERLSEENEKLKRSIETLESELATSTAGRDEPNAATRVEAESGWLHPLRPSEPLAYLAWLIASPWTWVAIAAALALAFAAGVWLTDWNQRRRHGGFRV